MTKTVAQRGGILDNLAVRYAAAIAKKVEENILVKHYRPTLINLDSGLGVRSNMGGVCIAFRHKRGDSFIEMATANCSMNDMYNRKAGTVLAVEALMNGQCVRLQLLPGETPADVVAPFGERYTHAYSDLDDRLP